MSLSRDNLLNPSLSGAAGAKPPYSLYTVMFFAMFGGPLATIAIIFVNSVRLRRWRRDLAPLGAVLLTYVACTMALIWIVGILALQAQFGNDGRRVLFFFDHVFVPILLCMFAYLFHRKEMRMAALTGQDSVSIGWIAGIFWAVLCFLMQLALIKFVWLRVS